jgi:hypothetical protein
VKFDIEDLHLKSLSYHNIRENRNSKIYALVKSVVYNFTAFSTFYVRLGLSSVWKIL